MPDLQDHRIAALHLLDFGTFQVGTKRTIGIPGYLITTDRNANILIDTGFHPITAPPRRSATTLQTLAIWSGKTR